MGKFHLPVGYLLGLLCSAVVAFPAVASTVSVDVSPTTGYTVTNRSTVALPPRTTSGPIATYNPTLGPLAGGGAYQTTSSGITITGVKGDAASTTMSGRINATAAAMRNGLTRCLTSFRCNAALMAGSAGIQSLFNGIDYILGEGGQVQGPSVDFVDYQRDSYCVWIPKSSFPLYAPNGSIHTIHEFDTYEAERICPAGLEFANNCTDRSLGYGPLIEGGPAPIECRTPRNQPIPPFVPVPPSEIPDIVDSSYNPDPSDLPYLSTGGLDFSHSGVDFEIFDIPSITGADSPSFVENSDGTSKGTYSEFEFTWTGPSKQPQVDVEETTTETTYGPSGEVISTTITNNNSSGSPANNDIEIPTDCDFMPTVCRFIDWFTEPDPELSNEPDFNQLIDTIDIEREFTVGSITASCPAPFQISLAWVPSVEVSLQPFCDLADLLRPFLLSLCFLYSGMIILRT